MRMTALSKVSVTNPYPTGGLLRVLVSTDSSIPGATGLFNFRQSEGPQQYHTVLFTHVHGGGGPVWRLSILQSWFHFSVSA